MSRNFKNGFIDAFMEHNKNIGTPKKFLLWSAIAGVSACLERRTWVRYTKKYIYPNQFIMLVADSGVNRKSTSIKPITQLLKQVKNISESSTQFSAASFVTQLKEAGDSKSFEYNGIAYKNSSLFCVTDEATVTIGEKNGLDGVQMMLTNLYDCGNIGPWSLQAGWEKRTQSGGKIEIFNPCFNLLSCSTPSSLMKALADNGIEGGFASRVIFVVENDRSSNAEGWVDEDEEAEQEIEMKLIEDLNSISKLKGPYSVDESWKPIFTKYQIEFDNMAANGGQMKSYYARKLWHCIKLSQVLAADQSDEMVLTGDHLEAARGLLEEIEPDMYSPFPIKGENKQLASFIFVWDFIRRKNTWDRKTILAACFKHATTPQLDEHLRTLQSMGKVKLSMGQNGIVCDVIDNSPLGRQEV